MDLTVVIVNFQTPDLVKTAIDSFKKFYPDVPLLIIENGSKDESPDVIRLLAESYNETKVLFLEKNIYHGPAMDLALSTHIDTEFGFFLDSDTETLKEGFLEEMVSLAGNDDQNYGVGEFNRVNKRGFSAKDGVLILWTPYMLLRKDIYKQLSPFHHHGQPTLANFTDAESKGYKLVEFPVSEYIDHKWRGTADRFGYGLGWRGKLDYLLNKLGM
ncbi:MAG: glycosyltransferase [Balneola sp.]|nr:MAG: glycosyltransferase [Balneola sp.]